MTSLVKGWHLPAQPLFHRAVTLLTRCACLPVNRCESIHQRLMRFSLPTLPVGPDCSLTVPSTESFWILPSVKPFGTSLARASHKVVVQDKVMWVVGGYTFNYSSFQMILK